MKYYALLYDMCDDYLERRGEHRAQHFELAHAAVARGELRLGGAFDDAPWTGLMIFHCDSPEPAERFAQADPYVRAGIVRKWQVREWNVVMGADFAPPR